MTRRRICRDCYHGHQKPCHDPACACCGDLDYEDPDPVEADSEQYAAEEDRRLNQQLGYYPDETSGA